MTSCARQAAHLVSVKGSEKSPLSLKSFPIWGHGKQSEEHCSVGQSQEKGKASQVDTACTGKRTMVIICLLPNLVYPTGHRLVGMNRCKSYYNILWTTSSSDSSRQTFTFPALLHDGLRLCTERLVSIGTLCHDDTTQVNNRYYERERLELKC